MSALADAHLAHYLAIAVDAEPHLRSHDQLRYWARLDPELDNFTAALQHALTKADPTEALQLVVSLRNYWSRHGLHTLASDALDAELDRTSAVIDPRLYCRAEIDRAWHYGRQGRFRAGNEHAERAISAARALDDPALLALALVTTTYDVVGEPERTLAHADEALALATDLRDSYLISCALQRRGGALRESDSVEAHRCIEESLELDTAAGDQDGIQVALVQPRDHGSRSRRAGRVPAPGANEHSRSWRSTRTRRWKPACSRSWDTSNRWSTTTARRGRTSSEHSRSRAVPVITSIMVESLLGCAMTEAVPADSAMLHGAADALLDHLESQFAPTDARARELHHDRLRALLGDETFAENYARGRSMTRSQIMSVALRDARDPGAVSGFGGSRAPGG